MKAGGQFERGVLIDEKELDDNTVALTQLVLVLSFQYKRLYPNFSNSDIEWGFTLTTNNVFDIDCLMNFCYEIGFCSMSMVFL